MVTEKLNVQSTSITGTVDVTSNRTFTISGYVNTSGGPVTTKVTQTIDFSNDQYFDITSTNYLQDISLGSSVSSTTTTSGGGLPTTVNTQTYKFPLTMDIHQFFASNGDLDQTTTADQTYSSALTTKVNNLVTYTSNQVNTGQHKDTVNFNTFINSNQSSAQQYNYWDSTAAAYVCDLAAVGNLLTYFSQGCAQ